MAMNVMAFLPRRQPSDLIQTPFMEFAVLIVRWCPTAP